MKKNKLYITISIITLICFLGTSALCNQAGGTEDEAQTPTLKLQISEGPTFSEEDNTCSYEIEAIVTGSPEPDIEFTLDDNVSLLATEKAKVVLNDSSDTYTLEGTATNSEGSTIASINLSWGCEEEVTSKEDVEESEEEIDEEEFTEDEETVEEEQDNQGEVLEGDPFPPDLSIFKYEGPIYSAEDDVCYYRIAAELYGNPYPKLTWSKDDSDGAFGWDKVQINLRRGETYTLTATATSVEGSNTKTIELSWGCDEQDMAAEDDDSADNQEDSGDGEDGGEAEPVSLNVNLISNETVGMSVTSNGTSYYSQLGIGDDLGNTVQMGFISFDINPLKGATITEAILTMNINTIEGDLSQFSYFYIGSLAWGERRPGSTEYNAAITAEIYKVPSSGDGNIVCSNDTLKVELQKAINSDLSRFQLKAYFSGSHDDRDLDKWVYEKSGIALKVKYIP